MRIGFAVVCALLLWNVGPSMADEPASARREAQPAIPDVKDILREASALALTQIEARPFWLDRLLLRIGELQSRAGDIDGALKSISAVELPDARGGALLDLAKVLARQGKEERALEILRPAESERGWHKVYLDDVHLARIEYLLASRDIDKARKAIEGLKSKENRQVGLRLLAFAYAKSGDATRARESFARAIDAASSLEDAFGRAYAFFETAKLAARAKDEERARHMFRLALDEHQNVNALNKMNLLRLVAAIQADAGYIDDAFKTASKIKQSVKDIFDEGDHESVLLAIAMAQLKANDVKGAIHTALSVRTFTQYRDDALHSVIEHQISKKDLSAALETAEKVDDLSRRAVAILKVAAGHAQSGERKSATDIAASIRLTHGDGYLIVGNRIWFDYRAPRTWGVRFNDTSSFTGASHNVSVRRAAEVAAAAMALAQALEQQPAESYAKLFNDINMEEVVRALARTHAATGDANQALAWAKQIGSDQAKSKSDDDRWAFQRRVHALIGVAEGILDRSPGVRDKESQ